MVLELIGNNRFQPQDELYKKYFADEPTKEEYKVSSKINSKIEGFTKKVFNKELDFHYYLSYKKAIGYYKLEYGDWGYFYFDWYTDLENYAFKITIDSIIFDYANKFELKNRERIINNFKKKFDYLDDGTKEFIDYARDLVIAKFKIKAYNKYFDNNIPDNIIDYILAKLNDEKFNKNNNLVWGYNNETQKLTYKKQKVKTIGEIK